MTTTARTHRRSLNDLEAHRQAAYHYVGMGKIYAAADTMRRRCDSDDDAITKNLTAIDRLTNLPPHLLDDEDRAVAIGVAAQCAITAIRSRTRAEVEAMSVTDLAALLSDSTAHAIERVIGTDNLHDRYMKHIGVDAYDALLGSWITSGKPDHEVEAHILTELGAD